MDKKQVIEMAKESIWKVIIDLGDIMGTEDLPEDVYDSLEAYRGELKQAVEMIYLNKDNKIIKDKIWSTVTELVDIREMVEFSDDVDRKFFILATDLKHTEHML